MNENKLSIGIDTSNYKTSVAVVDSGGNILFNSRELLHVDKGQRGLRQSEAFFQHVKKLPEAISAALEDESVRRRIACVSVSDRPRPIDGSYMPVFMAGLSAAEILSSSLGVPLYRFSHQEGHIEAVKHYSKLKDSNPVICFHFSGGTTEAVLSDEVSGRFEIVGGSRDISYGQVLDRIGVSLGYDFPCGEELDKLALSCTDRTNVFSRIKVNDGYVNLSGIETQGQRLLSSCEPSALAEDLFAKMCRSIEEMTLQIAASYNVKDFIFAGGVSSSEYMRGYIGEKLAGKVNFVFGDPSRSSDNAIGTALLGGKKIWL